MSYIQDPAGRNCFYTELREFRFIAGDIFTMMSPDSGTEAVELEVRKEDDSLVVQISADVSVTWPLVTGIAVSDLQNCEGAI